MRLLILLITLLSLLLILGWNLFLLPIGIPLIPLGALLLLPLLYFSWKETLVYCLIIGLAWESSLPFAFGSVSIPLTVGCLILQLLARHQLRANFLTQMFCAVLLQSMVTIAFGIQWPPHTFAGAALQMSQTIAQLFLAATLSVVWLWAMKILAKKRFSINLESRLKDL